VCYTVELKPSAERAFGKLDRQVQGRLRAVIDALAEDPHPPASKKLQGLEGLYRVRVGDYRIVYQVEDDVLVVLVIRIGHRREVYRGL
jgi:mRNA interferase RelE/StbE